MSYGVPCSTCGYLGGYCSCDEVFVSVIEFAKPIEDLGDITEQLVMDELYEAAYRQVQEDVQKALGIKKD